MLFHEIKKSRDISSHRGAIATPDHPPVNLVLLPEYICIDNEETDAKDDNLCVYFLKRHKIWDPLVRTVKFCVHFLVVMGTLGITLPRPKSDAAHTLLIVNPGTITDANACQTKVSTAA